MNSEPKPNQHHTGRRVNWLSLLKLAVITVIIVFIAKTVRDERSKFIESNISLSTIQWPWLLLASISYLLGMLPMALNWHLLLNAMQKRDLPRWETVRTHFISQFGKYVPGKAVVVAIRIALLRRHKVDPVTTFVSIVAETLTMMSVGAVVAASVIAIVYRSRPDVALAASGMALLAGWPVIPPVLRFAVSFLQKRKAAKTGEPVDPTVLRQLTWGVVVPGWLGIIPGWFLMGLSLWAVMKALNVEETRNMSLTELPWITASYTMSVVAGFLSLLPSGVGVRETAMKELLEPSYGTVVSVLAPVLHRITSLMSELVFCSILYFTRNKSPAEEETPDAPP